MDGQTDNKNWFFLFSSSKHFVYFKTTKRHSKRFSYSHLVSTLYILKLSKNIQKDYLRWFAPIPWIGHLIHIFLTVFGSPYFDGTIITDGYKCFGILWIECYAVDNVVMRQLDETHAIVTVPNVAMFVLGTTVIQNTCRDYFE